MEIPRSGVFDRDGSASIDMRRLRTAGQVLFLFPSCCSSSWVVLERDDVTAAEFDRLRDGWLDDSWSDRESLLESRTRSGETDSAEVKSRETGPG